MPCTDTPSDEPTEKDAEVLVALQSDAGVGIQIGSVFVPFANGVAVSQCGDAKPALDQASFAAAGPDRGALLLTLRRLFLAQVYHTPTHGHYPCTRHLHTHNNS